MGNAKIIPRGFGPALALVLLAGAVGGFGQWWVDGASGTVQLTRCGALFAEAWEAAVVEEVLFRGVLLWACLAWARRRGSELRGDRARRCGNMRSANAPSARHAAPFRIASDPARFAVVASSLIFGIMHLIPAGPLVAPGTDAGVALAQGFLKVAQATLFGAVMAALVVRSPYCSRSFPHSALSLVAPIVVHGLFDLLFWGPLLLTGGALPSTYLTGNPAELFPLAAVTMLLAGAAKCSFRH